MMSTPGFGKKSGDHCAVYHVITFPIACILSALLAWIFYALKKFNVTCAISFLPIINLVTGGDALTWLEIFNHGTFA